MSEQRTGLGTIATPDVMSALDFQQELCRIARFDRRPPVENPLAETVLKIRDNPAFTQSRLLARLLTSLTYQSGEFRRAEASAFDTTMLALAVALINASRDGKPVRDEWISAVTAADAAAAA